MTRRGDEEGHPDERIRLFGEIYRLYAQNLWTIGLVGDAPYLVVVQDRFRNVPQISYYDIYSRWLANTATECYAIAPEGGPETD